MITVPALESGTLTRIINRSGTPITVVRDAGINFEFYQGFGNPPNADLNLAGGSVMELMWRSTTTVQMFGNGITVI